MARHSGPAHVCLSMPLLSYDPIPPHASLSSSAHLFPDSINPQLLMVSKFQASTHPSTERERERERETTGGGGGGGGDQRGVQMSGAVDLQLPPGFRFHPTDEELVNHYLCRKCASLPIAVPIIADVNLYKYDPWQLPGLASCGEKEWYFFSPRDRKYPNGSRPNRAAGSGYWKATGADKPVAIGTLKPVAIKKALVFYAGKAPKGEKSDWIMHEYRLADVDRSAASRKNTKRLDDWVLCRIYNKKGGIGKQIRPERTTAEMRSVPPPPPPPTAVPDNKPPITSHVHAAAQRSHVPQMMDLLYLDSSDSMPRQHADSSCSEHVLSPEFAACEREVQSQPRWREWERALGIDSAAGGRGELPQFGGGEILSAGFRDPLQDIFMYLQKPF